MSLTHAATRSWCDGGTENKKKRAATEFPSKSPHVCLEIFLYTSGRHSTQQVVLLGDWQVPSLLMLTEVEMTSSRSGLDSVRS